jgi:hypothetical protein
LLTLGALSSLMQEIGLALRSQKSNHRALSKFVGKCHHYNTVLFLVLKEKAAQCVAFSLICIKIVIIVSLQIF